MLSVENRQLFGEQVDDHVAKLNDLMGLACGQQLERTPVEKVCFAGRLLEGSTRMLGLDEWSRTLSMFRELLEKSLSKGRPWDENVSQIASEILETEEATAAGLVADEECEIDMEPFGGLQQELKVILDEPFEGETEQPESDPPGIELGSAEETPFEIPEPATDINDGADIPVMEGERSLSDEDPGGGQCGFATIVRLQDSLMRIDERLEECLKEGEREGPIIRDLELAVGESEFFMAMLASMLSRLADNRKTFRSKVTSQTVMNGLKDFIGVHGRLRNWKTELRTRVDDFSLERDAATDLVVILENCVFDICRMGERNGQRDVQVKIDVSAEGSFLTARIFDDADVYLSDSQIDRDDAMAYYHGLLQARSLLSNWGALLWVEPGGGNEDRFRFTFPRTSVITDYHLIDSSGITVSVPRHSVDDVIPAEAAMIKSDQGGRFAIYGGSRIPVCRIDELAADELRAGGEGDHVVVLGLAEKRIGIMSDGPGRKAEGLIEQVTEDSWASLSRRLLHIGEREFPVLDVQLVLDRFSLVQGYDEDAGETGSWVDEAEEVFQ